MSDPEHNRHTVRLPGYDYAQTGGYFVTIVTHGRECALGTVVDGNVILSNQGIVVQRSWRDLPQHFHRVVLDGFVIMPNHVHGIIMITEDEHAIPGGMGGFRRGDAFGMYFGGYPEPSPPNATPHRELEGAVASGGAGTEMVGPADRLKPIPQGAGPGWRGRAMHPAW